MEPILDTKLEDKKMTGVKKKKNSSYITKKKKIKPTIHL